MKSRLHFAALAVATAVLTLPSPSVLTPGRAAAQTSGSVDQPRAGSLPGIVSDSSVVSVVAKSWRTLPKISRETQHSGGAALGGILYVVGGQDRGSPLRTTQSYNPKTRRWRQRARLPVARMRVAAVSAASRLFAVAGESPSHTPTNTLLRYNPASNRWTKRADLPASLEGVAAASGKIGGKATIFVFGGTDRSHAVGSSAYAYDIASNSWTALTAMPSPLTDAQAVRIGATVYVLGGFDGSNQPSRALFIYDIASGSWTSGATMPANFFGAIGAAPGKDGRIYAIGLDSTAKRVDAYIPGSDSWATSPPNLSHPQAFPASATIGSWIYAAAGNPGSLTLSSEMLEALKVT